MTRRPEIFQRDWVVLTPAGISPTEDETSWVADYLYWTLVAFFSLSTLSSLSRIANSELPGHAYIERAQGTFATVTPKPALAPATLKLGDWKCYSEHGVRKVKGEVRNQSGAPLRNVAVVARYYTDSGQFVKSDWAAIKHQPLAAGETSPFALNTPGMPEIGKCNLSFQTLLREPIAVED